MAKHQNAEIAKAAATNALQRKQSVPDLNELNNASLKSQNRVTFSSSLNLNAPSQSGGFQVVQIQTNPTQQPIYASRNQLRREIQELYGSLGTGIYGSLPSDSSYLNGFFNKVIQCLLFCATTQTLIHILSILFITAVADNVVAWQSQMPFNHLSTNQKPSLSHPSSYIDDDDNLETSVHFCSFTQLSP